MKNLVNPEGTIDFGIYKEPVETINYKEYRLETPMGLGIPGFVKRFKFNQFHFFGLIGPDVMVGMAVVDLKYLTNGFFISMTEKPAIFLKLKNWHLPVKILIFHFCLKNLTAILNPEA